MLLFTPFSTNVLLRGGTDVQKSPPIDYTKHILLPFLKKLFGIECNIEIRKRGFSSYGGGELFVTVDPLEHKLKRINLLERGDITGFTGIIWSARQEYPNVLSFLSNLMTGSKSVGGNRQKGISKNLPETSHNIFTFSNISFTKLWRRHPSFCTNYIRPSNCLINNARNTHAHTTWNPHKARIQGTRKGNGSCPSTDETTWLWGCSR